MNELKKLNRKLFYLWVIGLIIGDLAKESLKNSFLFSKILGGILLTLFLICKFADVWEWVETIKNYIEEIINEVIGWFGGVEEDEKLDIF